MVVALSSGHTSLAHLLGQEAGSIKEHVTAEARTTRTEVTDKIQVIVSKQGQEAARQKLLGSLKYPSMNARRNQIHMSHEETFEWAFADNPVSHSVQSAVDSGSPTPPKTDPIRQSFVAWMQTDGDLFWITGKPGSGKSTLMKFLSQDSRTQLGLTRPGSTCPDVLILSHFIWSSGLADERSIKGMLCSLLHQLIWKPPETVPLSLCSTEDVTAKEFIGDWSSSELEAAVVQTLGSLPGHACIFLDGLDEIDPSDGQLPLLKLVLKLSKLPRTRLCVASRAEPVLDAFLSPFPGFRIHDRTEADIRKYATGVITSLSPHPNFASDQEDLSRLVRMVCHKAEGVFLWVHLVLKSLQNGLVRGDNYEELSKRVEAMPNDLNRLFQDMWRRLDGDWGDYRRDAAKTLNNVLSWAEIAITVLPSLSGDLTVQHLAFAADPVLASDILTGGQVVTPKYLFDKRKEVTRQIESRCAGLLEVGPGPGYHGFHKEVRFIHRTARDFLRDTEDGRKILQYDDTDQSARRSSLLTAQLAWWKLERVVPHLIKPVFRPARMLFDVPSWAFTRNVNMWLEDKYLTPSAAMYVMHLAGKLYHSAEWDAISLIPEGPGHEPSYNPHVDLIAVACYEGFSEYVFQTTKELSSPSTKKLPEDYKSFLLSACLSHPPASRDIGLPNFCGRPEIVEWLLYEEGVNLEFKGTMLDGTVTFPGRCGPVELPVDSHYSWSSPAFFSFQKRVSLLRREQRGPMDVTHDGTGLPRLRQDPGVDSHILAHPAPRPVGPLPRMRFEPRSEHELG